MTELGTIQEHYRLSKKITNKNNKIKIMLFYLFVLWYSKKNTNQPKKGVKKMTDKDFKMLPRNADGDIIHIDDIVGLLSEKQIDKLTDDDWQRYDEAINMEYC